MPTLPLPAEAPILGDLPVTDVADVLPLLPGFLKPKDPPPVRDAILAALVALFLQYQIDSETAAGMSDVLRATDFALSGLGEDRGVFRVEGEDDVDYRARILGIPEIVTPNAIVAAVNAILAPITTIQCQYCEAVQDRWYLPGNSSTSPWHSYVWGSTQSMSPGYYDRLYEDDKARNLGYFRPNSRTGGARIFDDAYGRTFMIRIPDISGVDQLGAFLNSDSIVDRFYVGGVGVASAVRVSGTTTLDTFNNIVTTIQRLKGHSIRFVLEMDPKLKS